MKKVIDEIMSRSSLRNGKETTRFFFQKLRKSDDLNQLCSSIVKDKEDMHIFDNVPKLVRNNPYFRKEKREEILQTCDNKFRGSSLCNNDCMDCPIESRKIVNRNWEVRFCCRQFVKHNSFGEFSSLDFQTPLKVHNDDESRAVGEIDYIFAKDHNLWICEVKVDDNTSDSLVKTVIEIETYWRILNSQGLSKMMQEYNSYYNLNLSCAKKAIVVYKKWWDSEIIKTPSVRALLEKWDITVFEAESLENNQLIRI